MHSVPSLAVDEEVVIKRPHGGGSFSHHRLKNLEKSDRRVLISSCGSHANLSDSSESKMKNLSTDDLGSCLNISLKIQDNQNSTRRLTALPKHNDKTSLVKEDELNDCHGTKLDDSTCFKGLEKCATFPCSNKAVSSDGSVGYEEKRELVLTTDALRQHGHANSMNQPSLHHSISLPTPLRLVSAMKGSRETQGKPMQKLSVTWAPDVYDPTPTAASHVPSNKSHRRRSEGKRNGKNKQKSGGKSSRRSKSKDKKQARKIDWHSDKCNNGSLHNNRVVSPSEPLVNIVNFDVGNPDPFCGSSFLKKSVAEFHFPVAT